MTNVIDKTGRMYVAWPRDPDVQSRQNGIDKVIESIERTEGQYGWGEEVISDRGIRFISEQASYRADDVPERDEQGHWRGTEIIDDERNQAREKCIQEYGQRSVYEIRVRYVGNVDANGRFTEVEQKTKKQRKP